MRPLVLTPRGVLGTLAVLVVAGVCVRLGVWQLDRRAERLEHNRVLAERMAMAPVRLTSAPEDTTGLAYRRAIVAGTVNDDRAIVLAGRSLGGAPGVHLLSPVRIGEGAVLVNRGWLPAPDGATAELDPVRLEGPIEAEGILLPFPDVDLDTETGTFRERWFRMDGGAIRSQYPYPVAPLYLRATSRPWLTGAEPTGPAPVPLEPPTLDVGPHLSYAIQWFSFAAIALIGWGVLFAQRKRSGRSDEMAPGP